MPPKKKASAPAPADGVHTPCDKCPIRANKNFRKFEKEEVSFVESFKVGELAVQEGSTLLLDGHDSPHLYTVLDGWAVRYKTLEEGQRQVLNFALPGDFIGLQSTLFDKMQHSVEALTDMRLCVFSRERVWEVFEKHAGLAYDLTWIAAREESILADHLANVGQRSAFERLAYMIMYLFDRSRKCGLTRGSKLKTPVTQEHLADAMGLSIVHTNKTLQKLRGTGWIEWKRQEITMKDEEKLSKLASYDNERRVARPFI